MQKLDVETKCIVHMLIFPALMEKDGTGRVARAALNTPNGDYFATVFWVPV